VFDWKNNILLVFVLLAFVGQIASAVYCPVNASQESMVDMNHGSVSSQLMDDLASVHSSTFVTQDCCNADGCYMAGCFFPTLSEPLQFSKPNFDVQVATIEHFMATSQFSSSLYRPPILA